MSTYIVPAPITTYALFYNGEYLTNEQMNDKKYIKLISKYMKNREQFNCSRNFYSHFFFLKKMRLTITIATLTAITAG